LATVAGLIVGFLVGMTGMGGGALMTPFLILILKMNPVTAVGTDLAFAAVTKITGGYQHWRQHTLRLKPVLWMALGSIPASLLGSHYIISRVGNEYVVQHLLPLLLGIVLIVVGILVVLRALGWLRNKENDPVICPQPWSFILIGAIGGLLVGLTSVGGGTIIMALLMIFYTIPAGQLVAMDVSHGALLALFTASTYAFSGHVDWSLTIWLLIGSLPGVWLGARAVKIIPQRTVRIALGILLLLAGINLFINNSTI